MKVLLDIMDSKAGKDLVEAFNDVKLHEEGKKRLRSAKDFLNEL